MWQEYVTSDAEVMLWVSDGSLSDDAGFWFVQLDVHFAHLSKW